MVRRSLIAVIVVALATAHALAYQGTGKHFGAAFTDAKAVSLADVLADVNAYAGKTIKVEGKVKDVCQNKGCWLVVTDGEREIRVTFKDYGFFVPKDSAEREVTLEGTVAKKTISEGAAQHYAEESGRKTDSAGIKGPQEIVTMVATGVELK
jgi:hypothetical protein